MDIPVPIPLPVIEAKEKAKKLRKEYNHLDSVEVTCEDCKLNAVCEYAFDPYNTHGDCLAMK